MKRSPLMRIFTLLLALILTIGALPVPARAAQNLSSTLDLLKKLTRNPISGEFSDEKFWRTRRYSYPFEFDEAMKIKGFTMDYEILEVDKGSFNSKTKFEIYVRTGKDKWKSVKSFTMSGYEKTIEVTFSKALTVDAVGVICQNTGGDFYYTYDFEVYNPISADSNTTTKKDTTKNNTTTYTYGDAVSGYWGSEKFYRNGRYTYPYELNSTIQSCTGFTLTYNIVEVEEGNLKGNFKYGVWGRNTKGKWKLLEEFKMDGYSKTVKVTCQPISLEAIAVVCGKQGSYSYSHTVQVSDPLTK